MYKYKLLLFLIVVVLFLFGLLLFTFIPEKKSMQNTTVTPRPTNIQSRESIVPKAKIEIDGILMNDFNFSAIEKNNYGDTSIVANGGYTITYISKFNRFLITILDTPFELVRQAAEDSFLTKLGISKEQACKLNVELSTTRAAYPELAGQVFSLSFCSR